MDNLTVNIPLKDLLELYAAVNQFQQHNDSLSQMRREIEGLRSMLTEVMLLIGELKKNR